MNRVLIVYGTSEGHTRKVCKALAATLEGMGLRADVFDTSVSDPLPVAYDGIIIAASVHIGRYQRSVVRWVRAHAAEFGDRPTTFVSICLAAAALTRNPKVSGELAAIVERFADITGWRPRSVTHIPGALLYTQYNLLVRWVMKRIAAANGGDTDTSRDYEYTDWAAVRRLATEFGSRLRAAA